jgi:hypothetical protein
MMLRSKRAVRLMIAGAMALGMAACTTAPAPTYPDITWRHLPTIPFAAGPVEKVAAYSAPAKGDLQPDLPFNMGKMAMNWPDDRIETAGTADTLRYTVTKASITQHDLKTTDGFKGMFTDDQSEQVDLQLEAKLEVIAPDGRQKAEIVVSAQRSRTLSESMSVTEREQAIYKAMSQLLMDYDHELETQIKTHMSKYVLN